MKSKKTIVRELKSLVGLMRLGLLLAAMVLTAGCGSGGDDPDSSGSGSGSVTPSPEPGTTPEQPTPSDNETAIVFSARQEEGQDVTRASSPLESVVTLFKVWGFKNLNGEQLQTVFPAYAVKWVEGSANTTTTNSDGWEYVNLPGYEDQTIKYWDWSVMAYRFFGVAESQTGRGKVYDDGGVNGIIVLTVDLSSDEEIDKTPFFSHLWYSTGNLVDYPNRQFGDPVQLEFVRPISKVRISFMSSDPSVPLGNLELSNPQFMPADEHGIAIKGTFTVSYPLTGGISETWSVVPDDLDGVIHSLSTIVGNDNVWHTVLPAMGQGVYKLIVDVSGEPRTCFVPAEFVDWLPGYEYTYIFKVNEEGGVALGEVHSAYTNWQFDDEAEHTVHNW